MVESRIVPRPREVDVVIPTFNNRELVLDCIAALKDPVIARLVLVDDVSTDDTIDAVAREAPNVTILGLTEHRGLSHAFNEGSAQGDAPYVLFLNDDVIATEGAIGQLVEHLDRRPDIVFAGGRLADPRTGRTQERYKPRPLPSTATLIARLTGVERYWQANPWSGQHLRDPLPEDVPSTIVQQPAGACLLVRRSALDEIGGWDERFWFWYEDVDLAARLLRFGRGVWDPQAVFLHVGRHSTRSWDKPKQHARLYHSTLCYAQAHLSTPGRWLVSTVALIACSIRIPLYGLRGRREAARIYLELAKQAASVALGFDPGPPYKPAVIRRRSRARTKEL
jgi:N-acetylglucosaminyl-diphospho-decaprenol L-rhamnosyltransferase